MQLHAGCVSIGGRGVLLLGESGSGKSDLALRLIERGAVLVADDRVDIAVQGDALMASAPQALSGLMEVRGLGVVTMPCVRDCPLALAVKLVQREAVERMPDHAFFDCLSIRLPLLSLHAFDASTPFKIQLALERL